MKLFWEGDRAVTHYQNTANFIHLNFISKKKKNRETFFPKIPQILELEVGFFSTKKKFFAHFPKYGKFYPSKLHFEKNSQKIREPLRHALGSHY